MGILANLARIFIAATIIVVVAELSKKWPRYGALLLSLPIVSILAFAVSWLQHHDLPALSRMAKETLVLVPLGLPFFVPLALAPQLGLGFWPAMLLGIVLAAVVIASWFAIVSPN